MYSLDLIKKIYATEQLLLRARRLLRNSRLLRAELDHQQRINRDKHECQMKLERDLSENIANIDKLTAAINQESQHQQQERNQLIDQTVPVLRSTWAASVTRRQRLLSDLVEIYPIIKFPDRKGGYSICDIHLPSSEDFDGHDETMVSVAIGYVSHLLIMLSQLLDVPLRYPIKYMGSRSLIFYDDTTFPLYKSRESKEFDSGVFLLNLNIVQLRYLFNMPPCDARNTLSNLYELIYDNLLNQPNETPFSNVYST